MILCRIWLTFCADRGSLFPLFPTLLMERNHTPHSATVETRECLEQRAESQCRSVLQRLREGVRAKVLAAGLAIGGATLASEKSDAAIMRPAEVLHSANAPVATDDEVGFVWDGGQLRVSNLEDRSNRDVRWIGFRSLDDTEADASLPLPGHAPVPDRIIGPNAIPGDGIKSPDYILDGRLQVREDFFLALGLEENGQYAYGANRFLEGSQVFVGLSPIEGAPQTIDEAIAMTNGVVYEGLAPSHLDSNTPYIIRPLATHAPEPSTALLGGVAAGFAAAGRRRRREKSDNR